MKNIKTYVSESLNGKAVLNTLESDLNESVSDIENLDANEKRKAVLTFLKKLYSTNKQFGGKEVANDINLWNVQSYMDAVAKKLGNKAPQDFNSLLSSVKSIYDYSNEFYKEHNALFSEYGSKAKEVFKSVLGDEVFNIVANNKSNNDFVIGYFSFPLERLTDSDLTEKDIKKMFTKLGKRYNESKVDVGRGAIRLIVKEYKEWVKAEEKLQKDFSDKILKQNR